MLISPFGTKRTERSLGLVADFCALCRALEPCDVIRVGRAGHFCFISFGAGQLVDHIARCRTCGSEVSVDPSRYASFEKRDPHDIEALAHATFPDFKRVLGERLTLEERIKSSPQDVPREVRMDLLIESLFLLDPPVRSRYTHAQFDRQSGFGCLGAIAIATLIIVAGSLAPEHKYDDEIAIGLFAVTGLGILYAFVQLGFAPRRYLYNKALPSLARAWSPLRPSREEIDSVFKTGKRAGVRICAEARPDAAARQLELTRAKR